MKWQWKLGRFAGIDLNIHVTFLLLIGWVLFNDLITERSLSAALSGVAFTLALFAFVILHEYGHALTARRFGIATRDITLLPIGGVARLERMPDDPKQEFWIAIAGPAVNVVIAAILIGWIAITAPITTGATFIERLIAVNISLVIFNLLPAFPMDGGRVLRALLALRVKYVRATEIAARVGQAMAVLFGIAGLFINPFLILIAFFVWSGAEQELAIARMKYERVETPFDFSANTQPRMINIVTRDGRVIGWVAIDARGNLRWQ